MNRAGHDEAISCYEALRSEVCCRRPISVPGWVMFIRGGLAAWLSARRDSIQEPLRSPANITDAAASLDNVREEVTRLMAAMLLSHQRQEVGHGNRHATEGNGKPS